MPLGVVASSGWDVICHAIESYTARPFTARPRPAPDAVHRALSQGANPYSDKGCIATLELAGKWFRRAVTDASDRDARTEMSFAATMAGMAFGNAGTALPHGMSYAISGLVKGKRFCPPGYTQLSKEIVPHGMSVVLGAPASFSLGAAVDPFRHAHCAALLGSEDAKRALASGRTDISVEDAQALIHDVICDLMRCSGMPNGLAAVGYTEADIPDLVSKTLPQKRVTGNAPFEVDEHVLAKAFRNSMKLW